MSRLIDADELIKYIKIWEIGTSISSGQSGITGTGWLSDGVSCQRGER